MMRAVVLTGRGSLDELVYREDVPVLAPDPGEALIAVGAYSVNNTDTKVRARPRRIRGQGSFRQDRPLAKFGMKRGVERT